MVFDGSLMVFYVFFDGVSWRLTVLRWCLMFLLMVFMVFDGV